ncbi:MAG: LemA family protein [Thermodesulfobacteriota bacterium]|nr:LemA family protein [Thermodesulfobacteriota bacterium]
MNKNLWAVLGIVIVVIILFVGSFISQYNKAIRMNEAVSAQWAQVENQLKRRFDLIPNLVETVKGYAAHEKEVFEHIADARKAYFAAKSVGQKARAAGELEGALSRLLLLQERYPELKANESFLKLHDSLEGTENRIAVERKRYNDQVRILNTYVKSFPGRFFAAWAGVEKAQYFKIPEVEKETPKVKF